MLDQGGFTDSMLKAQLPKGDPAADCIVLTPNPSFMSITRLAPCTATAVHQLKSDLPTVPPTVRSGTCTFFLMRARD
jgi:hypothetical protein